MDHVRMIAIKDNKLALRILFYILLYIAGYITLYFSEKSGLINYVLDIINYSGKSFEHYLHLYNKFICLIILSVEYLKIVLNIENKHFVSRLLAFFIFSYIAVSFMSASNRLLGFHGLWHYSILARMDNIPIGSKMDCPFLGSLNLQYPWIGYYLIYFIAKITHLSYSWSMVLLHCIELTISFMLLQRIIDSIFLDKLNRKLAILLAFSGSFIVIHMITRYLNSKYNLMIETRIAPPSQKFFTVNTMPSGICCFMIFFYSLFRINEAAISRLKLKYFIGVFLGTLGVAYTYPALIFSVLCCGGVSSVLWLKEWKKYKFNSILILLSITAALSLALPYWDSISSGYSALSMIKPNMALLAKKTFCLFITFCLTVFIYYYAKTTGWKPAKNKNLLYIKFNTFCLVLSYLFLNMPSANEYKCIWVASFLLGLIACEWLSHISNINRKYYMILILLLSFTPMNVIKIRLFQGNDNTVGVKETSGMLLPDNDMADAFQWIKQNTPADSQWLCQDLRLPAFTGRSLYVWDGDWSKRGIRMDILRLVCRYDDSVITARKQQAETLLKALRSNIKCNIALEKPIYILTSYMDISCESYKVVKTFNDNQYMIVKYESSTEGSTSASL